MIVVYAMGFSAVCDSGFSLSYSLPIFVVTYWERADLLALLYVMFSCVFVTFSHTKSWVRCGT